MEFPILALERRIAGPRPKNSQCEANLTAASHILHSSRPDFSSPCVVPALLFSVHTVPWYTLTFNGLHCQNRRPYQELIFTLLHLIGTHQSICIVVSTFFLGSPDRLFTCDIISDSHLGPVPIFSFHLDESRCLSLAPCYSWQKITSSGTLGAREQSTMQAPQAAKPTSCMQRQLSKVQICDLIPLPGLPFPPPHSQMNSGMPESGTPLGCWAPCLALLHIPIVHLGLGCRLQLQ